MRHRRIVTVLVVVAASLGPTSGGAARAGAATAPRDSASAHAWRASDEGRPAPGPGSSSLFGRHDLFFGAAFIGLGALAASNDRWITREAIERPTGGQQHLASAAQPLGNLNLVVPALLVTYGAARFTGHRELAGSVARIGLSVGTAGALTLVLKEAVGRSRPIEAPDDADDFHPFSGHASFPSGHTTLAFATATALDRETSARWVPWIAYPVAALVGWSRVRQQEHWTSDVIAGAALGIWTANKVETIAQDRAARARPVGLLLDGGPQDLRVGASFQF